MTRDALADVTVDSTETFESLLQQVVEQAVVNGVDVSGAWAFETRGSVHNWEVEIVELAREYDEDEDEEP